MSARRPKSVAHAASMLSVPGSRNEDAPIILRLATMPPGFNYPIHLGKRGLCIRNVHENGVAVSGVVRVVGFPTDGLVGVDSDGLEVPHRAPGAFRISYVELRLAVVEHLVVNLDAPSLRVGDHEA